MIHLSDKKCVACEGGVPPLGKDEAEKYLTQVSDNWHLEEKSIWAEFKFKDFKENMTFVNKIADIAEAEGHHPDLKINYNKLRVDLSTHAIGGLSENDFILAAKIDKLDA